MAAFTEGANFSTSANGKTLDPRLLDILKTAAAQYGMDVQATSGVQGRSTGTKNHPGGYAVDIKLIGPDGKALPNYQNAKSFPAYEKFAQTARVVQQQKYPELNNTFRWGGYFAGGVNPMDLMHFDINPTMHGAMGGGSWDNGVSSGYAKARGITTYNPGLATVEGQRQVASIKQGLAGGPLPPMNIPQVGTALDVIDRAAPRPMPSSIASAYAAQPKASPPPLPVARPKNIDNGGFNMAPPNLPLNAPLPANRGASYGPNTGQWGPTISQLGMQSFPPSIPASGRAVAMPQSVGIHGAASLTAPAIDGIGAGPQWGDLAGMLGSGAPIPMPGRPAAPVQAQPPQLPAQRPSAPVVPPVQTVLTASGDRVAVGIHDQGDHSVMVSDDGTGHAKIERIRGPGAIPGVIDPLREVNSPTVAGGIIRSMIPKAASDAVSSFNAPSAVDTVKSAALGAANNLGSSIGGMFGGMFGGAPRPVTWAPWGSIPALPQRTVVRAPVPVSRPISFFAQPQVAAPRVVSAPAPVAAPSRSAPSSNSGYFGGKQNAINDTLRTLGFNV